MTSRKINSGVGFEELNQKKLIDACKYSELHKIDDWLFNGGDPCAEVNSWTALHRASEHKTTDVLKKLFESGKVTNVDIQVSTGATPLQNACQVDVETVECVRLLIMKGASVTRTDSQGYTALHYAARRKTSNVLQIIFESVNPPKIDAAINLESTFGTTPLLNAVHYGCIECVELLVQRGANVLHKDKKNHSVLHFSVWSRDPKKVMKCLKWSGSGIDINGCGEYGRTALIEACNADSVEVVRLLILAGADYTIQDSEGRQAEYYGRKNNNKEILILLNDAMKEAQRRKSSLLTDEREIVNITTGAAVHNNIHNDFWDSTTMAEYSEAMGEFSCNWIEEHLQKRRQSNGCHTVNAALPTPISDERHNDLLVSSESQNSVSSREPDSTNNNENANSTVENLIRSTFEIFTDTKVASILVAIEKAGFDLKTTRLQDLHFLKESHFSQVLKGTEAKKLIQAFKKQFH